MTSRGKPDVPALSGAQRALCRLTPHTWLRCGLLLAGAAGLVSSKAAIAAPEEIQVYMDEMSDPGQFGLDLHTNFVATGRQLNDYPEEQQSLHRPRVTPEFAYGLTKNLELGLYLPLATMDQRGHVDTDGVKARIKFIAPRPEGQNWFWGANFEIGAVKHKLDENPVNAQLKGIIGTRVGRWTIAFNGNVDFKVSGPASSPAAFDVDTKISYALSDKLAVGIETYNGTGGFNRFGAFGTSEQASFVAIDTSLGRWDLNFGVGAGYGSNRDQMIIKAIVGVPIE